MSQTKTSTKDPYLRKLDRITEWAEAVCLRWTKTGRLAGAEIAIRQLLNEIRKPVAMMKEDAPAEPQQTNSPTIVPTNTVELTRKAWRRRSARRKYLTIVQRREVISSYKEGATLKQLAQQYGVHFSSISRIVNGRKPRGVKRKLTFAQAEMIRCCYREQNQSVSKLAHDFKVSQASINLILQGKQYKS